MTGLVEGIRGRGRPRVCWLDNIVAWTGLSGVSLLHATRDRRRWPSAAHLRSQPSLRDDGLVTWHDMTRDSGWWNARLNRNGWASIGPNSICFDLLCTCCTTSWTTSPQQIKSLQQIYTKLCDKTPQQTEGLQQVHIIRQITILVHLYNLLVVSTWVYSKNITACCTTNRSIGVWAIANAATLTTCWRELYHASPRHRIQVTSSPFWRNYSCVGQLTASQPSQPGRRLLRCCHKNMAKN